MKIAIFTDTYHPQLNGVTVSIDNFVTQLTKKGHTVYIFAPQFKEYKKKEERVYRLPSFTLYSSDPEIKVPLPTPNGSLRKVFSLDFDIVHAHGNGAFSLLGHQVARMKGIPFVLTFHTFYTKYTHYFPLKGRMVKPSMIAAGLRVFANLCDVVIAPAEKMKKELQTYGVKKPIIVIPNFVDPKEYAVSKKDILRERFSLPKDSFILITVGRLAKEKNFPFLVTLMPKLLKMQSNMHLVIVGPGPEREILEALAKKLGVSSHVHFTGKIAIDRMPDIYASADLFLFASQTEVHPMVALEAAAAGLPLIVVNDEAFDRVVMDAVNGFVVPLHKNAFIEKILVISHDPKLRKRFGEKSAEIVREKFSPDKITDQLISLYHVMQEHHSPKEPVLTKASKITVIRLRQMTQLIDRFFDI